ncbi:MAG: hypothetical protein RL150_424 [Candidatus Parcubacteria bacterium]|jgi:cellulose synthase/poly-beta-1,6-N-acetylglucosamine synthase-like glycosyltransferase
MEASHSAHESINEAYIKTPAFSTGHAFHLTGKDRRLFRMLEILPGALAWGTILLIIVLSFIKPVWAAFFVIAFDLYWLLKTVHLSLHHRHNWKRLLHNIKVDWAAQLEGIEYSHLYHMIILPFYKEGRDVVEESIVSLLKTKYDASKIIMVLAGEERAGDEPYQLALEMQRLYKDKFGHFIVTRHPADVPGEMPGKGSNISYAAEQARIKVLDAYNLPYENVLVSAFDIDTVAWEQYLLCLTWHFLTTEDRYRASYQPVPLYNNNIWEAPAVSRVAAMSSTFWQMIQQERPEKLTTFSSHSVPFVVLHKIGYWQKNMVSEDSRIFWNLFFAHDGNYRVVPISYPVSMDANLAPSFWQTMINIYKQHRRWSWGVENIPYMLFNFIKHKGIPLKKKIKHAFIQIEGFWSLATNPLVILLLGWFPILLGGAAFRDTVLSYNLPIVTRNLMIAAMAGLVLSAVIAFTLIPAMPQHYKRKPLRWIIMGLQWLLIPFTIIIFGAIPGLDAQTRLMVGKYMGFWVTPKHRGK